MRGARKAIAEAAMRIFAGKGFAGTSIREICEAAGVTKPVLYYHFHDKAQLYHELMIDSFGASLKLHLEASRTRGTIRQRLVRIVSRDFKSVREAPERIQFLLRMIFAPEDQRPYFNYVHEMERQRQVIEGVLQEGIDAGIARGDARQLATALMGMNLMAILEHVITGRPTVTRRSAERQVDTLLKGCQPADAPIPGGK
ncbi:MAG TPA: TetR/AcrR family transcriptional regulator [Acidobacteriota bacterium]|nr:TetR/AcrR family transcriptional regulator [Acidobacteriota bacterium]